MQKFPVVRNLIFFALFLTPWCHKLFSCKRYIFAKDKYYLCKQNCKLIYLYGLMFFTQTHCNQKIIITVCIQTNDILMELMNYLREFINFKTYTSETNENLFS